LYAQVSAAVLGIRADVRRLAQIHRDRNWNWISRRRHRPAAAVQRIRGRERGHRPSDRGRRRGEPTGSQRRGKPTGSQRSGHRPGPEATAGAGQTAALEHAERRRTELAEENDSGVGVGSGRSAGAGAAGERLFRGRRHCESGYQNIPETVGQGEGRRRRRSPFEPDQHGRGSQG